MGEGDKRDSLRVDCTHPIRIYALVRQFEARMLDISRTGMRISIPITVFTGAAEFDLAVIADSLEQTLGKRVTADLHYEMLGQLIRKRLNIVRIGSVGFDAEAIDVGCEFVEALSDEETMMLGMGLPPVGVTTAAAYKAVPPPQRRGAPEAKRLRHRGYEGILHAGQDRNMTPLVGKTDGMLNDALTLVMPLHAVPGAEGAPGPLLLAGLKEGFGASPRMEVLDGLHMVWAGPVGLLGVELLEDDGDKVLLHMQAHEVPTTEQESAG